MYSMSGRTAMRASRGGLHGGGGRGVTLLLREEFLMQATQHLTSSTSNDKRQVRTCGVAADDGHGGCVPGQRLCTRCGHTVEC